MDLVINQERCIKCGTCARICPTFCITFAKENYPQIADNADTRCMKCQHCLCVCPTAALSILGLNPDNALPKSNYPSVENVISLIKNRRSCRAYKKENVDKKQLDTLIQTLASTPTGVNFLGLHFSVIDDMEVFQKYREQCNAEVLHQIKTNTLPPQYAYFTKFEKLLEAGFDPLFRGAPHAVFVSVKEDSPCGEIDPIIALSYFELLANTMGLGTTWWGLGFYLVEGIIPQIEKQLGIPDGYKIGYAMLFGNPAVQFKRAAIRPNTHFNIVSK